MKTYFKKEETEMANVRDQGTASQQAQDCRMTQLFSHQIGKDKNIHSWQRRDKPALSCTSRNVSEEILA